MKKMYGSLAILAILLACGTSKSEEGNSYFNKIMYDEIKEIISNPTIYENKQVTIKGKVKSSTNIQVVKFYYVSDGEHEIIVFTKDAVPLEGSEIVVRGKVSQLLKIDDEQMTGIREESRN